jgi:hypothetical protein
VLPKKKETKKYIKTTKQDKPLPPPTTKTIGKKIVGQEE